MKNLPDAAQETDHSLDGLHLTADGLTTNIYQENDPGMNPRVSFSDPQLPLPDTHLLEMEGKWRITGFDSM